MFSLPNKFISYLQVLKEEWLSLTAVITTILSVTSYFEVLKYFKKYNIAFLEYGSLSDILLLGLRVNTEQIFLYNFFMLLMLFLIGFTIFLIKKEKGSYSDYLTIFNKKIHTGFISFFLFTLFFMGTTFLPVYSEPDISTKERVTIAFEKSLPIKCVGMLATTTDWLFLWDHKIKEPIIVSKSKVLSISTIVEKQPLIERTFEKKSKQPKRPDILIDTPKEIALHNSRLNKLKNVCNENIHSSEFR
jgi:hypothetical protein